MTADLLQRLPAASPPPPGGRQPVHTVYGGAHLFKPATVPRFGEIANQAIARFGDAFEELQPVRERVLAKLAREPVEDYRLDFEDGYGLRSDEEEDGHCRSAAEALRQAVLPPFVGIRLKPLTRATGGRALRTLELILRALGPMPPGFLVTIPKVEHPEQPAVLVDALERLEAELGLDPVQVEIMVETPSAVMGDLRGLVEACRGRCRAAHFGAYDYTAALGVSASQQDLGHPACDFARQVMQAKLASADVWISDGATSLIPVGEDTVRAWRRHYANVRRALVQGLYQGWDLHPAQLVARYAAVYAFFQEGLEAAAGRLRHFVERQGRATRTGADFDDAATGQGLLNHFLRGMDCGALSEEEVQRWTGLSAATLRKRAF